MQHSFQVLVGSLSDCPLVWGWKPQDRLAEAGMRTTSKNNFNGQTVDSEDVNHQKVSSLQCCGELGEGNDLDYFFMNLSNKVEMTVFHLEGGRQVTKSMTVCKQGDTGGGCRRPAEGL